MSVETSSDVLCACRNMFHCANNYKSRSKINFYNQHRSYLLLPLTDPAGVVKGSTWGPNSVQKDRHQRSSVIFADGRWSKSAPNLEKTLKNLSGHSNIGALKEFCK